MWAHRFSQGRTRLPSLRQTVYKPCEYCGRTGFHKAGKDCPAYGKQCRNCDRWNHFAAVCKSRARNESSNMQGGSNHKYERKQTGKKSRDLVKKTTEYDTDSSFSSDDEFISHAINHLSKVKKVKRSQQYVKNSSFKHE